jgi:hypothetical protein
MGVELTVEYGGGEVGDSGEEGDKCGPAVALPALAWRRAVPLAAEGCFGVLRRSNACASEGKDDERGKCHEAVAADVMEDTPRGGV